MALGYLNPLERFSRFGEDDVLLVFERNLRQAIMGICQALLDVSHGGRIALCPLLTLSSLFLLHLSQLFQSLDVADARKIENLKSSGQVIILVLVLFFTFCALETALAFLAQSPDL